MGIEHATIGMLILLLGLLIPVAIFIRKAKNSPDDIYVRRIPGIDAVDEAVGRAAELGRPVSFTTGLTDVGPVLYACMGILNYIVKKVANYKTRLVIPQNTPEVMAIVEDAAREAYRQAGKGSQFDPKSIVYLSDSQFAFASGYMGTIHREQVASTFLFGSFAAESLLLAEAGQQIGAMQVAGSVSPEQTAFFICTCDYTIVGEELFAASAYLSREPIQLGSLCGQDRAKLMLLLFIVAGVGIATWNMLMPEQNITNVDKLLTSGGTILKALGL
jgi:hypothetical protein